MAFYAEMKRRNWYCICGTNMISWYSNFLYDEWWNSLTEEQRERIIQRRKARREKADRECREVMQRLLVLSAAVSGIAPPKGGYTELVRDFLR